MKHSNQPHLKIACELVSEQVEVGTSVHIAANRLLKDLQSNGNRDNWLREWNMNQLHNIWWNIQTSHIWKNPCELAFCQTKISGIRNRTSWSDTFNLIYQALPKLLVPCIASSALFLQCLKQTFFSSKQCTGEIWSNSAHVLKCEPSTINVKSSRYILYVVLNSHFVIKVMHFSIG